MKFPCLLRFVLLIFMPVCLKNVCSFVPPPTTRNVHTKSVRTHFRGGAIGVSLPRSSRLAGSVGVGSSSVSPSAHQQDTGIGLTVLDDVPLPPIPSSPRPISNKQFTQLDQDAAFEKNTAAVVAKINPLADSKMSKSTRRWLKYGSLFLLVLESSALTCTMRWSRACSPGPLYYTSTAVILSECLKIIVSSIFLLKDAGSFQKFKATIQREIISKPDECLKLLVPGLLYTLQNNLQYVAASNLEPAVFQVTYQIKMLTTAVLSVTMLNKKLKLRQWGGVSLLMVGLVLVQLSQGAVGGSVRGVGASGGDNSLVGFSAVLSACTFAGFAGCYLERILKGCTTSLWIRNIQLSIWGSSLGFLSMIFKDGKQVYENGFFYGYNKIVFSVIGIQAIGGLLISLVVRYGDALLKGFATGLAIILTTVISWYMFDFHVTPSYLCGASLTLLAILMYSGILSKVSISGLAMLRSKLGLSFIGDVLGQGGGDVLNGMDATSSTTAAGFAAASSIEDPTQVSAYPWSLVAGGGVVGGLNPVWSPRHLVRWWSKMQKFK